MKAFAVIFLLFLVIPTAEIYLLIKIGQTIGAGWTILAVVSTAFIGAWLIKLQGIRTAHRCINTLRNNQLPAVELIEGVILLLCAALLITPGFVTDSIGFLCLITLVRRALASVVLRRAIIHISASGGGAPIKTYEAQYKELK